VWEIQQPLTYKHRPDAPEGAALSARLAANVWRPAVLAVRLTAERMMPGGPRYGRINRRSLRPPRAGERRPGPPPGEPVAVQRLVPGQRRPLRQPAGAGKRTAGRR
jgi:hypothetical protein